MGTSRLHDDDRRMARSVEPRRGGEGAFAVADAAIEGTSAAVLAMPRAVSHCPRCGGSAMCRWGKSSTERRSARVVQRWRCGGCCRTFSTRTGTLLAGIHAPGKFEAVLGNMLGPEPASCRDLASRLALDKTTIWQWRLKIGAAFAASLPTIPSRALQLGETVLRESRKASRMWVDHARDPDTHAKPDRLRWLDYRLRGMKPPDQLPQYRVPVGFLADRHGDCHVALATEYGAAEHLPPCNRPPRDRPTKPVAVGDWSQSEPLDPGDGARPRPRPAIALPVGERPPRPAPDPAGPTCQRSDLHRVPDSFRDFIRPFRGPATVHLAAYVAWFSARLGGKLGGSAKIMTMVL
jgi:transposase-like protein